MGVTIAYKVPGILNDETVRSKPNSYTKRNKEATEDLPEPRFVLMILLFSSNIIQYHKVHIEIFS